MAATSIPMISKTFYRSELDNQYTTPLISCVDDFLTLQFLASFHPVDVFSTFDARECTRSHFTETPKSRDHVTLKKCFSIEAAFS